jgi:hypothetical protein
LKKNVKKKKYVVASLHFLGWCKHEGENQEKKMNANIRPFLKELYHENLQCNQRSKTGEDTNQVLFDYYKKKLDKSRASQSTFLERQKRHHRAKRCTGFEHRPRRRKRRQQTPKTAKTAKTANATESKEVSKMDQTSSRVASPCEVPPSTTSKVGPKAALKVDSKVASSGFGLPTQDLSLEPLFPFPSLPSLSPCFPSLPAESTQAVAAGDALDALDVPVPVMPESSPHGLELENWDDDLDQRVLDADMDWDVDMDERGVDALEPLEPWMEAFLKELQMSRDPGSSTAQPGNPLEQVSSP